MFIVEGTIGREDLCNQTKEISDIKKAISEGKRTSLYAPRKHGKTSIIRNIVLPEISNKFLPLYIDMYSVGSIESASKRIMYHVNRSLKKYISTSEMIKKEFIQLVSGFGVKVEFDPNTGSPSLTLSTSNRENNSHSDIYKSLEFIEKLSEQYDLVLVFDEFQDVSYIEELEAILRSDLQHLRCPMVFLGSRMSLMSDIFNNSKRPFYDFLTKKIEWKDISIQEWHNFFNQNLEEVGSDINFEAIQKIQDIAMNVPKTMVEIGNHIYQHYQNSKVGKDDVNQILEEMIDSRIQDFRFEMSKMSPNELAFLKGIARYRYFPRGVGSAELTKETGLSASSNSYACESLLKTGYIENIPNKGIRVSNPLTRQILLSYDF